MTRAHEPKTWKGPAEQVEPDGNSCWQEENQTASVKVRNMFLQILGIKGMDSDRDGKANGKNRVCRASGNMQQ